MSHAPTTSSNQPQLEPFDDPEPGSTWFVSLAGVVVLVALVIFIAAVSFRTGHHEFEAKVVDRSRGAIPEIPTKPLDAASARTIEQQLSQRREDGLIGRAEYTKLSQSVLLNSWMRYPWEDSKGATKQLIRIPVSEAMRLVAEEYRPKGAARPVAVAAPASAPAARDAAQEGATP